MHTVTTPKTPAPTDGPRLLREYLTRTEQSVQGFCKANGLDRIQVGRVLNGQYGKRVSVDFAESIETATKKAVPWKAWLHRKSEAPAPAPRKRAA